MRIAKAQLANGGSYTAMISNAAGTQSSAPAILIVQVPPSISVQPQGQAVTVGQKATFLVIAAGFPAPNYQWSFNGAPIPDATKSVLIVGPILAAHAGAYSVVVTNAAGLIASEPAILSVGKISQSISFPPLSDRFLTDSPITLTAAASSGLPVAFRVISGRGSVLNNVLTLNGAGLLTVRASQPGDDSFAPAGDVDQSFQVLDPAPRITLQPKSQSAGAGENVAFAVQAAGAEPLSYSWRKDGVDLLNAGTAVLTINNVRGSDAGDYTVIVRNGSGSVISDPAKLIVGKLSQFISFPTLSERTFGDPPFQPEAASSAGLPVQFSIVSGPAKLDGARLTLTGAGQVTIRASQAGNIDYAPAPDVDQTFLVAKATQTIQVVPIKDKLFGALPFPVESEASSGLSVTLSVVSGPATASGKIITITGAGSVQVRASQPGDLNFKPAPDLDISFNALGGILAITQDAQGGFFIIFDAEIGRSYILEASENLLTWTTIEQQLNSSGQMKFTGPRSPNSSARFYRIRISSN